MGHDGNEDKVQMSMSQTTESDGKVEDPQQKDFKEVWRWSRMSDEDFISICWLAFSFFIVSFYDSSCMTIPALIE